MLLEQRTVSPPGQTWCTYTCIYGGFVIFSRGSVSTRSCSVVWFFVRIKLPYMYMLKHSRTHEVF